MIGANGRPKYARFLLYRRDAAYGAALCSLDQIVGTKRVTQPLGGSPAGALFEQDGVETARCVGMRLARAGEPQLGGEQDALLLALRDAGRCATEAGRTALAHLDENDGRAVAADQIEFAAAKADLACQHDKAVAYQPGCCGVLGSVSAHLPGGAPRADNAFFRLLFVPPRPHVVRSLAPCQYAVIVCGRHATR